MKNTIFAITLTLFAFIVSISCETEEHKRDVKELERIQEHRKHLDRRMEWIKDSLELYKYA